jgi:nucleoside-diphosphate-sugar epimerase
VTVLVTGAAGFIGSRVVRSLVESDQEVAAMVLPGDARRRLADIAGRIQIVEADLRDKDSVARLLERLRPEACLHLAWYVEPGKYLDSQENLVCLQTSLSLLEELGRTGCQHLVGVGTCFEYDIGPAPLREDSPTKPVTLYAASKLALYLVAAQRAAQLGIRMAWARLFYLYGPYEDQRRLVPAAIKALLAGREFDTTPGDQVRDYMHVDDVASGISALSVQGLEGPFNVCSGAPVTIAGLMQTLGDLMGRPELIRLGAFPYRAWDPMYVCGDSHRLQTKAQWHPRHTLRDGLAGTIEWWKGAQ